jgi:hypothetical protein
VAARDGALRLLAMTRTASWLGSIALAGVVALAAGCGPSEEEEEFDFDGDDMREAIEGTWTGTVTRAGTTQAVELTLAYQAPAKQAACGNRELGADSPQIQPQCTTDSSIGLTGTMTIEGGELSGATVKGSFIVSGTEMQGGWVEAQVSQPNPPPDETVLELGFSGYIEDEHLIVTLQGESTELDLTRE